MSQSQAPGKSSRIAASGRVGAGPQGEEQGKGHGCKWLIPPLVDSEMLLPGLDSFIEPIIIMGVWDTAGEGYSHCSQGFWPEGSNLGLWQGVCSAPLGEVSGPR